MKIRKYFLLVMALIFINFLNLNASQKRLGEMEATNSLVSSTKLNLVQKNDKKTFTIEVYRSNGKLSTKSEYELEDKDKNIEKNEIKKLYEEVKSGKIDYSSKIIETYYENGNLKTRLTDTHVKEKLEEYDENGKLVEQATYKDGQKIKIADPSKQKMKPKGVIFKEEKPSKRGGGPGGPPR